MTNEERFVGDEITHDQLFDILYQQPDISDSQLKTMLLYIEYYLIANDWAVLDDLLNEFDPALANKISCTSVVRFTYRAKDYLPHWNDCLERIRVFFENSGDDPNRLLRGLLNK